MASLKKQIAGLSVQAEAARAQLQAHSISSQKRTSQFEQQKAALEVKTGLFLPVHRKYLGFLK